MNATKKDKEQSQTGLYSEKHKLPSRMHEVTIREMTTREESLMLNQKLMRNGEAIVRTFKACVLEDIDMDSLLIADRYFLMLQIRRITYGDDYTFRVKCPDCERNYDMTVDLKEMPVAYLKEAADHVYEVKLPRNGATISFRLLRGMHEKTLLKLRKGEGDLEDALIPMSLKMHTVSINGDQKVTRAFFDKLGAMDSQTYRDEIDRVNCGIDTEIICDCPECGSESTTELPITESFFYPRGAKKA